MTVDEASSFYRTDKQLQKKDVETTPEKEEVN